MCFPIMNKQPRRNVNIPDLAGGVNYRDGITEVNDNQLTECKNMWFKDGVLRTRPSCLAKNSQIKNISNDSNMGGYFTRTFDEVIYSANSTNYVLSSVLFQAPNQNDKIYFYWVGKSGSKALGQIETNGTNISYFVTMFRGTIYCFVSTHKIYKCENLEDGEWIELSAEEIYAPIVLVDALPTVHVFVGNADVIAQGVMLNGYNAIGKYYRMIYSNCNPSELSSDDSSMLMRYHLLSKINDFNGETITLKYTTEQGVTATHTVTCNGGPVVEEASVNEIDGFRLKATLNALILYDPQGNPKQWKKSDYIKNNIEIIAPVLNTSEKDKVFSMTRATWFGGASEGINGGTRLFLGGNTAGDEESLMVWSGLNNPLYFPENAYAYVGNSTSAVTGFGKQSDMLVIFKENEIYFTQYQQNTNITADDLINQSVIDYASSKVSFPLTLINANIGCDIPDTVELCRNRLVWTNSNGKVYTLTANNQYSERNVYEVGEMVERKLKQLNLKHASACDFAGYYVLFAEGKAYLMDYNSNGYQYVYSYNKNDDAQKNIPWYEWEFSVTKNSSVSTDGVRLYVLDISDTDDGKKVFFYEVSENAEEGFEENEFVEPAFTSSLTTKAFDFGSAGYRKNVDVVKLFLGNNGGAPIKVEFVTDCGTVSEEIILDSPDTENYTAGYITPIHLAPSIRSIIRMAIKLSCDGKLAVDGAELTYRILGGAR